MKRYEKESLLKNFFVFFILLELLLLLLFSELYSTKIREYKQSTYQTMQVCSYTMECEQYEYDFVEANQSKQNELYDIPNLHAYFTIPMSDKYAIQLTYPQANYMQARKEIQTSLVVKFILASLLLFVLALFFTFYSLSPIRKALQLNDEFIKDILHDFNTPITSMILNIKMFKEEKGEDPFIRRISHSISNIMLLQNNLKCFLQHSPSQNTELDIAEILQARLAMIEEGYPKLTFTYEKKNDLIRISNEEILIRIFDNILSNACKYNKPKGTIKVSIVDTVVSIEDTGKGIRDVSKVMQRYYKEQDRGVGLGLHIVKKLIDELNIEMHIDSQVGVGTAFVLDFKDVDKA